jgi:hypothetical protein
MAARLTAEFTSMNGAGWTGGDAAWSARLPDGRDVWLFGDTMLGGVHLGRRDPQTSMVRNSLVVADRDGGMSTVVGGDDAHPQSLVPSNGADDWYWPGPPVASFSRLQVPMAHIVRTGPGGWDFTAEGTSLAVFSLPDLHLLSVKPIGTPPGVNMASAAVTTPRFTYVYGTRRDGSMSKEAFVARVRGRDLSKRWSYWTGSSWSSDAHAASPVVHGVSDQFSVVRRGRGWLLLTQLPCGRDVVAFSAGAPQGEWKAMGRVAQIPQIPHAITYNAVVHSEYSHGHELTLGYSVNGESMDWVYADASLYRPRFMTIDLS